MRIFSIVFSDGFKNMIGNNQILNFSKICRLCCAEGSMLSVFKVNIHKKITACTGIQVWQNDGMPHQICKKCMAKLHIAYQFKKQSEKSDFHLRQYRLSGKSTEKKVNVNAEVLEESRQEDHSRHAEEIPETLHPEVPILPPEYSYVDPLPLTDNRQYDSLQNLNLGAFDLPIEPQFIFNGSSILANMTNVSIPLQGNVHMPANYNIQSLNNSSFQNSFGIQGITQSTGIPTQILTLEEPPVPEPDIADDIQPYNEQINVDTPSEEKAESKPAFIFHKMGCLKVRSKKDIAENRCPICNKAFASNGKLTRHMKTHGDKPFKCKVCKKSFAHHGNFKVHMRVHNDERPFSCPMCHKACRQQQDLDKHMRTHTGERPHVCSTCDKAFATSSNLVVHERTHSGIKPYVCSVCQKGFCQSNELTKHMRTHTGEKSHQCPKCEKGFNGSSTLIVHMRSHSGERPYVCTICSKGFTQSSGLAAHARSHSAQCGYQCSRCPRAFPTIAERRRHQAAHGLANLPCPYCHRRFSRPNDLVRHSRVHRGR